MIPGFLSLSGIWVFSLILHFIYLKLVTGLPTGLSIVDSLISTLIFAAMAAGFRHASRYVKFRTGKTVSFVLNHFFGALFVTFLWVAVLWLINSEIYSYFEESTHLMAGLLWRIPAGMLFYFIVQSVVYMVIANESVTEQAVKEEGLKRAVVEAELKSLKFQINPHFLFNSLNSIAALTVSNPTLAREMTVKLSEFMRLSLSENLRLLLPFRDELKNTLLYVAIEKIRFDEKFSLIEEIENSALETDVPAMILQPLIENAFKHGVQNSVEKTVITISAVHEDSTMVIKVSNTNPDQQKNQSGPGVGLNNLEKRLALIYGESGLVTSAVKEGKYIVEIRLPIIR